MSTEVHINADMLTWAIARAGFELHELAEKVPGLLEWIEGTKRPTVKQLEGFSRKVHLPFGYLFLPEPPREELPIPFFRTNDRQAEKVSVNVYDTILLLQQRQDWLRDYLTENDFERLPFVGIYEGSRDVQSIVGHMREVLDLHENWASQFKTWNDALNHLVQTIEDRGIITVFNGVVENNTSRPIAVDECRGFVLVDEVAPFMFVNNADGKAAQMFTIVHELAHIWTGQSAGFDFRTLQPADDPNERLCDQVAAEFLVPETAFSAIWKEYPNIRQVSRHFKVSEMVIARRALDMGFMTRDEFFAFYNEYRNREFAKKESPGGDFYATALKRLSVTFATHVHQAVKTGQLLYRDAYKLTSMKGDTFNTFFTKYP